MSSEREAWAVIIGLGGFPIGCKVYYRHNNLMRFDWPGEVISRDEDGRYNVLFVTDEVLPLLEKGYYLPTYIGKEFMLNIPKEAMRPQ